MSHRSIYLGSDNDPHPVFRDEQPDAFNWPEGAVMAVVFHRDNYPSFAWDTYHGPTDTLTEFYDSTGWPMDLSNGFRAAQGDEIREELQVYPWDWRRWTPRTWALFGRRPTFCKRSRVQADVAHSVLPALPTLVS